LAIIVSEACKSNIELAMRLVFTPLAAAIVPRQNKKEVRRLLEVLAKHRPKTVLEIGTYYGGTVLLASCVSDPYATLISMDVNQLPRTRLLKRFLCGPRQQLFLVPGDSHNSATYETVKKILNGMTVDFLFIDGDHTYEGVRKDFEWYSKLVRRGGIVAFHDIIPLRDSSSSTPVEVDRFWIEVKRHYNNLEIVDDYNQSAFGIGVLSLD